MSALLVTYDLNTPGQDYTDLLGTIKSYSWARLSESSYAIATDKQPQTIYNELFAHMDNNDQLYVVTLNKPFFGYGPEKVNTWLEDNL